MERPCRILYHSGEKGTDEEIKTKTKEHRGSRHVSYKAVLEEDVLALGPPADATPAKFFLNS